MSGIKKTLEFATKVDTSDFDRAVEQMQKKLKDIYRPSDIMARTNATSGRLEGMGLGGNLSKPAHEAYQKSINQTKAAMDKFIADEAKGLEQSIKSINKNELALKGMQDRLKGLNKESKDYLELQKEIGKQEQNLRTQREHAAGKDEGVNKAIDVRRTMDDAGDYGARAGRGVRSFMNNPMGSPAMGGMRGVGAAQVGGAIFGIGNQIVGGVDRMAGYTQRVQEAAGSATQGSVGQDLSRVYGGKSAFESAWLPERKSAEGMAQDREGWRRVTDYAKGLLGVVAIGAGAAASTTGVGAVLGVPLMALGAKSLMDDDRARLAVTGGGKEYEKMLASERTKDFRSNLENIKNQDPAKKLALEKYEQDYLKELDVQRQLGLSDFGLRGGGGFQFRAHHAGFTTDQAEGMAGGIIGAGGSSRMGNQAEFGLKMQRQGLTNASGILGSLSNGIQSPESTKRATIGIMAEAFQIGLDNTQFAEENRRFTQAAAAIVGKSGATSVEDQDRITRMFGQFLGARTNQGVESASSAYEKFQSRGSQTSGRIGAVRMAMAQQDPFLSKLETSDLNELLAARPDQLKETDPMVKYLADKAGTTPKDLLSRVQKGRAATQFTVPGRAQKAQEQATIMNDYLKKKGMTYAEFAEKADRGGDELEDDSAEAQKAYGFLKLKKSEENPEGYNSANMAAQTGELADNGQTTTQSQKDKIQDDLDKQTDRMGDQANAAGAAGEDAGRKNLNAMTEEIKGAAAAAGIFTQAMSDAARALRGEAPDRMSRNTQGSGYQTDIINRLTSSPQRDPNMSVAPQATPSKK